MSGGGKTNKLLHVCNKPPVFLTVRSPYYIRSVVQINALTQLYVTLSSIIHMFIFHDLLYAARLFYLHPTWLIHLYTPCERTQHFVSNSYRNFWAMCYLYGIQIRNLPWMCNLLSNQYWSKGIFIITSICVSQKEQAPVSKNEVLISKRALIHFWSKLSYWWNIQGSFSKFWNMMCLSCCILIRGKLVLFI